MAKQSMATNIITLPLKVEAATNISLVCHVVMDGGPGVTKSQTDIIF